MLADFFRILLDMASFSHRRNVLVIFSPPSPVFVAQTAGIGATDDSASV